MIGRLALRIATVQALIGRTLAADQVFDSMQGPIEDQVTEIILPQINVYTDDATRRPLLQPRDLFGGEGTQTLVIEIAVTERMTVTTDTGPSTQWVMPMTDAGMEMTLDIIERQISVALADPSSRWADYWRRLAFDVTERQSVRGAAAKDGTRFAGRQLTWMVKLPRDPEPGDAAGPFWADFLALVGSEPKIAQHAPVFAAAIKGLPDLSAYDLLRATWSLSDVEARKLGRGPASVADTLA